MQFHRFHDYSDDIPSKNVPPFFFKFVFFLKENIQIFPLICVYIVFFFQKENKIVFQQHKRH